MRSWLQKLRNQKEMTHEDVATAANIKRAYYTMIENDTRSPSVNVAKRIAEVLDFDWTFFYDSQCNEVTHRATGT